jgi:hypothetical protein
MKPHRAANGIATLLHSPPKSEQTSRIREAFMTAFALARRMLGFRPAAGGGGGREKPFNKKEGDFSAKADSVRADYFDQKKKKQPDEHLTQIQKRMRT